MSARRILRRNAEMLKRNQQMKAVQGISIRTFANEDSFGILSMQSDFTPILSRKEVQATLARIRRVAAFRNFVYLTDVQCENSSNFFAIHKAPLANNWQHLRYNRPQDFDLFINPSIEKQQGGPFQVVEMCHSFPLMKSIVRRFDRVDIKYTKIKNIDQFQNGEGPALEDTAERLEGFRAIIAQHCMDHLRGRHFFTPELTKGTVSLEYEDGFFKTTKFLLKEYNLRVKRGVEQKKTETEEFKKMEADYQDRLRKAFMKEAPAAEAHAKGTTKSQ